MSIVRPVISKIDVMLWWSVSVRRKSSSTKNQEDMALIKAFFSDCCFSDKNLKDRDNSTTKCECQKFMKSWRVLSSQYKAKTRLVLHCYNQESRFCSADTWQVYFETVEKFSMSKFTADPQLLFQRALNLGSSEKLSVTLQECLSYELYPVAMSVAKADLAKFSLTETD